MASTDGRLAFRAEADTGRASAGGRPAFRAAAIAGGRLAFRAEASTDGRLAFRAEADTGRASAGGRPAFRAEASTDGWLAFRAVAGADGGRGLVAATAMAGSSRRDGCRAGNSGVWRERRSCVARARVMVIVKRGPQETLKCKTMRVTGA
ncbi:hypothetical protein GCM10007977_071840 [Dactylosporangium sucinum]|uniref:Uncharacterized protein n=1 Tax=Dactylosporangium sucinum TaxID=1424081 RepID=A0A917U6X0_9ACTN|nr:hypothetical protein GCM10007977_071840 [Dactylosporangium sucinum]